MLNRLTRGETRQRLPGTRREVEAIAALLPKDQTTLLLGSAANDAALHELARSGALKRYRYLHFAAHGETNPAVAMSSALILAPDPKQPSDPSSPGTDGRVTAQQIAYTWDLDADLVVLSACESGLGRYAGGEGYLGFAQALFVKGAQPGGQSMDRGRPIDRTSHGAVLSESAGPSPGLGAARAEGRGTGRGKEMAAS